MSELPKLYRVIGWKRGEDWRAGIVIRRKPSQIPPHLDREIMHMSVMGHHDGPNNLCMYEFLQPHRLSDAEDVLRSMGWEKIKKEETFPNMDIWAVYKGDKLLKEFDALNSFEIDEDSEESMEMEAEQYLDKVMLGEIEA